MRRIVLSILLGSFFIMVAGGVILFTHLHFNIPIHFEAVLYIATSAIFMIFALTFLQQEIKSRQRNYLLENKNSEAISKLKVQENLFVTLFENNNLAVALLNLDGSLCKVNNTFCDLLGYSEMDLLTMNFYYLIHPNDLNQLHANVQQLLDNHIKMFETEQQCIQKSGETTWIMTTLSLIRDDANLPTYLVAQVQNITLQKKAEERLSHMAYHDPLTGLANRNKLEQFVNHILVSSRRHRQSFAVMILDLDRFKNINDTIGHDAGDLLLQIVADRLRSAVRNTDMVARLGGDEFVLLITDVKKSESVAIIAQKILESILDVIVVKGHEIYITTSIGISLYPYDGENMQTLMKNADLALYRAKENGKNNYQFYTMEMTTKAQQKMALQNALGHALAKSEFVLHYQPKMDVKTKKITGVEALLRWKNKDYSMITPDEIIALAEETGLIIPVSEWVLATSCKQLKYWHDMGFTSLTMAINCSARQFKQGTFVDEILTAISKYGLSPQSIEVEVTESTIMQDPENTLRVLYALKDLGVQIVIDDFGTGYWSLNNLRRLSVDKIKIDKTFVKQITVDETSAAITNAIIAMVSKLDIKTIAEGVETREQYEFLAKEGCVEIQGYYLSQPLPEELMTKFLNYPIPDAEAPMHDELTT